MKFYQNLRHNVIAARGGSESFVMSVSSEKKMIQYFFDRDDFCFSALQICLSLKKIVCENTKNKIKIIMVVWCLSLNNAFTLM